jgi:hypothetical protein
MRPLTPPDFIVACAGDRVDSRCAEAMDQVTSILPYISVRFVDSSWLAPSELAPATLYWVTDVDLSADRVHEALRARLPLLLPTERKDLEALCEGSGCGYSYETASEATERIVWILKQQAMGMGRDSRDAAPTLAAMKATAGDR